MKVIMLAAGVGKRLGGGKTRPPKVMLEFGGKTLLRRHIEILRACGIEELIMAVGYRAGVIQEGLSALGVTDFVSTVFNPDYREGSIVSLWAIREALCAAGDVILMDGDVLYDRRLMDRLLTSRHANCFLMDRNVEPGEEPVKLCVRGGRPVDFHKEIRTACDYYGESVGFFRLSAPIARRLAGAAKAYIQAGKTQQMYEEALRDLLLAEPPGTFGFEDITGLPWIEIDFPEDIRRARKEILARLVEPESSPAPPAPKGRRRVG